MPQIPVWLQFLSSLATLLVAGAVAYVAWRQWRTAREKLVLDLFEKRLAVYEKVMEAAQKVRGPGRPADNEPFRLLHSARAEAEFLFGPEISEYIRQLIEHTANLGLAHTMMEAQRQGQSADGRDYPQLAHDTLLAIVQAETTMPRLLRPYLSMAQTLPGKRPEKL